MYHDSMFKFGYIMTTSSSSKDHGKEKETCSTFLFHTTKLDNQHAIPACRENFHKSIVRLLEYTHTLMLVPFWVSCRISHQARFLFPPVCPLTAITIATAYSS